MNSHLWVVHSLLEGECVPNLIVCVVRISGCSVCVSVGLFVWGVCISWLLSLGPITVGLVSPIYYSIGRFTLVS